tara:strand:- start:35 stop:442 length:408 start_codon:yes stop_codon:yes gene_type:complete
MNQKRNPLFDSLAAVLAVAIISLLTALPAAPTANSQSDALHAGLTELRAASFRAYLANDGQAVADAGALEEQLSNFITEVPVNAVNQLSTIRSMPANYDKPVLDGTAGWVYVPATGRVFPDLPGTDEKGTPYSVW